MKRIVLLCAGGMSTSILVNKMKAEAKAIGYECDIEAFAADAAAKVSRDADCVLLGPQLAYRIDDLKNDVACPMEGISMPTYGMMDGKAALKQARMLLGDL